MKHAPYICFSTFLAACLAIMIGSAIRQTQQAERLHKSWIIESVESNCVLVRPPGASTAVWMDRVAFAAIWDNPDRDGQGLCVVRESMPKTSRTVKPYGKNGWIIDERAVGVTYGHDKKAVTPNDRHP